MLSHGIISRSERDDYLGDTAGLPPVDGLGLTSRAFMTSFSPSTFSGHQFDSRPPPLTHLIQRSQPSHCPSFPPTCTCITPEGRAVLTTLANLDKVHGARIRAGRRRRCEQQSMLTLPLLSSLTTTTAPDPQLGIRYYTCTKSRPSRPGPDCQLSQ
jgi:hypothetical protein